LAVSVTDVPDGNVALQIVPQLIPEGLLVTVPAFAGPDRVTLNITGGGGKVLKVAVTAVFAFKVTWQDPVPWQAPLHPAKDEFAAGVAVSVTCVPEAKLKLQTCPQLMPAGLLVTVPDPVPDNVTVNTGSVVDVGVNVAVTEVFAVNVIVQSFVPLQAPPHPANIEFGPGVAVRVTWVPD